MDNLPGHPAKAVEPEPATTAVTGNEIPESQIEARPLVDPGWSQPKWKKPGLVGRYCNYVAQKGMRLEEALAQGFRVAKDTDCEVPGVSFRDGAFRKGDVLLLVIDRVRYIGALKYKEEVSLQLAGKRKMSRQVRPLMRDPRSGEPIGPQQRGKLEYFEPNKDELDALESQFGDELQTRSDVLTETVRRITGRG